VTALENFLNISKVALKKCLLVIPELYTFNILTIIFHHEVLPSGGIFTQYFHFIIDYLSYQLRILFSSITDGLLKTMF